MSPHPPLTEKLAVEPVTVRFTWVDLTVRCPMCQQERTYKLAAERPSSSPSCPHCGHPWRWNK